MPNTASNLLNVEEQLDIYSPPMLTDLERTEYFTLSSAETKVLYSFKNINDAIYFAISLTFFKLKRTLINFTYQEVTKERQHVMQRYFPTKYSAKSFPKDANTIVRLENKVIQLCNYNRFSGSLKTQVQQELQDQAPRHPRQRQLCKTALDLFSKYRCVIPSYTTLQTLISETWNAENKRVIHSLYRNTTSSQRNIVLSLLEKTDNLHRIVSIKKDMKSFTNTELLNEIEKHDQLKPIFEIAAVLIPKLRLPTTTVNYYASMVNYYNGARLKNINQETILLYLMCYSFTRYQQINDNLLEALKKRTLDYNSKGLEDAKTLAANKLEETKNPRQKASELLIAIHKYQSNLIPKSEIHNHIPESDLMSIAMLLVHDSLDKDFLFWKYIDSNDNAIKLNIRKIFLTIDFVVEKDDILSNVVNYMKNAIGNNKSHHKEPLPSYIKTWIGKKYSGYVIYGDQALLNRLEFLFYLRIVHHISTNKLTLKHSIQHKSIEDDLYPQDQWKLNKSKILKNINHPQLKVPIKEQLAALRNEVDALYKSVNADILNDKNDGIKLKKDKNGKQVWRLRPLEPESEPNDSLFSDFKRSSIVDVIKFVEEKTNFTKAFESIQPKSKKGEMDKALIMAVVLANAIRIGARKISGISDLNESSLLTTESAYIRTETLRDAVDIVNNHAAQLPIFKEWYINSIYHGSLDGLKLEVSLDNIKARHSSKFLGKGIGVSGYNAILNFFSITGRLIGTNEYEGNFTFEMVEHQNSSELQLDWLSTDKHGMNALNFLLFFLTGRLFAPRIPKPHREILWGFGNIEDYEELLVRPLRICDDELIIDEWDNIQRLSATLIMGEAQPSVIIRKLSSKNFSSRTKKAFVQFNHLIRTRFILRYIHDKEFRRAIMLALNRGEAYNNLYRAITILKKGEFRGKSEIEMEIWNQCTRLISSVILYYNAHILNTLYMNTNDNQDKDYLIYLSPSAWIHINLLGYYQFCGKSEHEDIERWIAQWDWQKSAEVFLEKK